ncbi:GNAT family N-acetyltransferase [Aeromicrobium sp. NPDC092404]|uniref:GNAT family N-acetyltransferase n=1 Tax=Aeromicrobium sp. NPDC092404 TaxID=3154976 RepID=UPI003443B051
MVEIRELADGDWPQVWPIIREVVLAGDTFTYDPGLTAEQARELWVKPAPGRTVVAHDGGAIVATAQMGANRAGPGSHVATASFMVASAGRGQGIGGALVRDALDWARAQGFAGMQFNAVAASNVSAVELYQRLGFTIIGTVPGAFEHPTQGRVGLHVMYAPLEP